MMVSWDTERDMRIWEMYYEENMTLAAIGKLIGVSRERIRQLRNRYDRTSPRGILRNLYLERSVLASRIVAIEKMK